MYTVYILQSLKNKRYYIGHAEDIIVRLKQHNSGRLRSTKSGIPWKVIHTEEYSSRSLAYKREREIKSYKGGVQFRALLSGTFKKRSRLLR